MAEVVENEWLGPDLQKSQLAGDLLDAMRARHASEGHSPGFKAEGAVPVIIEGNSKIPGGAAMARDLIVRHWLSKRAVSDSQLDDLGLGYRAILPRGPRTIESVAIAEFMETDELDLRNSYWTDQYLFGLLNEETIKALVQATVLCRHGMRGSGGGATAEGEPATMRLVHKIWLNHAISRFVFESSRTVKSDAARAAFAAAGEGIVWAVADTGIDGDHFHFKTHRTLEPPDGLDHMDFTGGDDPLRDSDGHGTHVAGIIAGETRRRPADSDDLSLPKTMTVRRRVRNSDTDIADVNDDTREDISGVAPKCKLLSLKVLETSADGMVGTLLAALGYVQKVNDNGRNIRIHGINLSLGYTFDARWFAAGQSPLCVEVDRLVRSGVVVVVAAGNSGYGTVQSLDRTTERASHLATISDPGNSELAITVGSTHRDSPHGFGISYFSAKGPTADGRMKPDVVAPGERIVSAALGDDSKPEIALFKEDTGTSMAAPHVSGAIAAFLSVRREFRGRPERIKQIFMLSATDLHRRPEFQGSGLIDVMRALQSV